MNKLFISAVLLVLSFGLQSSAFAARESRISSTKHNLSSSGPGTTKSSTETQICVFCHTPHGADIGPSAGPQSSVGAAPLWNKTPLISASGADLLLNPPILLPDKFCIYPHCL